MSSRDRLGGDSPVEDHRCGAASKALRTGNLFAKLPFDLDTELIEALTETKTVRVERIVSRGHSSPEGLWYEDPRHEWVLLVRGSATLLFESSETLKLVSGDWVEIPARRRHRVEATNSSEDTFWIAVYYEP